MGREILKSALMAVDDELNNQADFDFEIAAHVRDPRGVIAEYQWSAGTSSAMSGSSYHRLLHLGLAQAGFCRSWSAPIACSGYPRALLKALSAPTTSDLCRCIAQSQRAAAGSLRARQSLARDLLRRLQLCLDVGRPVASRAS